MKKSESPEMSREEMIEHLKELMDYSPGSRGCCECVFIEQKEDCKFYCAHLPSYHFRVNPLSTCRKFKQAGEHDG